MKQCYYELLEVDSKVGDTELKKLYRKKALQLHPDKNPDNVEEATRQFNLVRAAYEVLSDAQERAWYDSHKNQILMEDEDYDNGDYTSLSYAFVGTTTEEILRYFDPSMYSRIDDSLYGMYRVAGMLFEKLASEEVTLGKQNEPELYAKFKDDTTMANAVDQSELLFPRFGNSKSDYGSEVRIFYQKWSSFQSVKTFSWKDEYRYSRAQDRRTRRLMEKENKKYRDNARRDYNEAVRSFVSFVKKRDPRVKAGAAEYEKNRRKKEQDERLKQAQRDREANLIRRGEYEQQNWQTIDHDELAEIEEELNKLHADEFKLAKDEKEEQDLEVYECIICDKSFKTSSQFQTHENSNRHKKKLNRLKWEMRKEGIELGFDLLTDEEEFLTASSGSSGSSDEDELEETSVSEEKLEAEDDKVEQELNIDDYEIDDIIDSESEVEIIQTTRKQKKKKNKSRQLTPMIDEDESAAKLAKDLEIGLGFHSDNDEPDWDLSNKKKQKAKKLLKKKKQSNEQTPEPVIEDVIADKPQSNSKNNLEICTVCGDEFPSRNKLFQHVNLTGHALAPDFKGKGKKGKKGKR